MIGKLYTFLFLFVIIASLWYQRLYLKESKVEFNAQLMAENAVLPAISIVNYNVNNFENGVFKFNSSGKTFVYFSNRHYEAKDNLIYQEADSTAGNSDSTFNQIQIRTNKAYGEVLSSQSENAQLLLGKNKLKNVVLPHIVYFNLSGNVGKTSHVYFDVINRTMQTEDPIESNGPIVSVKGVGFFYSLDEGSFQIKSDVEGFLNPSKIQNK